jgi:molecular chaperone DnaK
MYALGIDLGTTFTAAAVWRDGRAEISSLGSRSAAIPSVVVLREDETIITGETAHRRALSAPHRVAREFKRRLGDTTPILLAGVPYSADALMGRVLRAVVDEVTAREGGPPDAVCVSHPANWGPYKTDLLYQAVRGAGLEDAIFTIEPVAAAVFYARQQRMPDDAVVAVYDLGGGTFDAAVLRKNLSGFQVLGRPEGIERLGGIDFDAAVYAHVSRALDGALERLDDEDPGAIAAVSRLKEECTQAKEALSADTDTTIPVLLPNLTTEVRLTRGELEGMVRPALQDTIEALRRALRSAGVTPEELHSVLLVGGSSRMPMVSQLVGAELGRPVAVDAHPKHAVALGAAMVAGNGMVGTARSQTAVVAAQVAPVAPVVAPVAAVATSDRPEAARVEASRIETARVEAARVEAARAEAARVEAARVEAARVEAARAEAARVETARAETARAEAARAEAARAERARAERARVQAARVAAARADAGQTEVLRVEGASGGVAGPPDLAAFGSGTPRPQNRGAGSGRGGSGRGRMLAAAVAVGVIALGAAGIAALLPDDDDKKGSKAANQVTATPTQSAAGNGLPADEQCTAEIRANERWVCLTSAKINGQTLTIRYKADFAGDKPDLNGYHLHIYGGDGVTPAAEFVGRQAMNSVPWYNEDQKPSVRTVSSDDYRTAIGDAPKVCARIALSAHRLVQDKNGGYATGNCVPIDRSNLSAPERETTEESAEDASSSSSEGESSSGGGSTTPTTAPPTDKPTTPPAPKPAITDLVAKTP